MIGNVMRYSCTVAATDTEGLDRVSKFWVSWRGQVDEATIVSLSDEDWRRLATKIVDGLEAASGLLRGSAFHSGPHVTVSCVVEATDASAAIVVARASFDDSIRLAGAVADLDTDDAWIVSLIDRAEVSARPLAPV